MRPATRLVSDLWRLQHALPTGLTSPQSELPFLLLLYAERLQRFPIALLLRRAHLPQQCELGDKVCRHAVDGGGLLARRGTQRTQRIEAFGDVEDRGAARPRGEVAQR